LLLLLSSASAALAASGEIVETQRALTRKAPCMSPALIHLLPAHRFTPHQSDVACMIVTHVVVEGIVYVKCLEYRASQTAKSGSAVELVRLTGACR
jgi:hypothetical protein